MRIIKYSPAGHVTLILAVLIVALYWPFAYSETEIMSRLNIDTPQAKEHLIKHNKAEENRMIREEQLYAFFSVKVTTTNQKKFDRSRDGYLSGIELKKYLAEYYR